MAVYFPAISISPSYTSSGTCYPLPSIISAISKRRRLSAVKLGFGDYDVTQYVIESRKHWDSFYERHQNKFFKDRHYLEKDWGQYFCDENDTFPTNGKVILEDGCGTGNTIFPLAKKFPQLFVHACDFSQHAVTLVKSHTNFREDQMNVLVCNIAEDDLCDHITPASVDIVTLVFTLSAVSPEKMPIVLQNIGRVLKFFKDRHYLEKDWGHYFCDENDTLPSIGKVILEAGCGTGNTIFPLTKKYPQLFVHACDFSHQAVTLVKSHTKFREDQMNVFVCNIAEDDLCDHIMPASVDIVTLVFTLSAVSPEKMPIVLQNIGRILKPNGYVLFRDYAIGDYAQAMLMNKNRVISENFYFRGDGTCSFYFSEDLLSELFVTAGFTVVDVNTYNREIENRAKNTALDTSSFQTSLTTIRFHCQKPTRRGHLCNPQPALSLLVAEKEKHDTTEAKKEESHSSSDLLVRVRYVVIG